MALDECAEYFQLGEINKKSNALQKEITAKRKVRNHYIPLLNDGARLTQEVSMVWLGKRGRQRSS